MSLVRVLRHWLPPVRRRTVLAGIGLGVLLPPVLILAGTIGINPLPDQPGSPRRGPQGSSGALSATQREVRRSLLGPADLSPGYRPVGGSPTASPPGEAAGGQAQSPAGTPSAAPAEGPLEFLPELPGLGLDPDDGDPPGDPSGDPSGNPPGGQPEHGHQPGGGPPESGPPDDPQPGDPHSPGTPTPGEPTPGTPSPSAPTPGAESAAVRPGTANVRQLGAARRGPGRTGAVDRCRDLIVAPWRLVAGHDAVAPQRAEFIDRRRGVRVWQALGALAPAGAQRAVELIHQTAEACPRFDTALPRDRRGGAGRAAGTRARGRMTVTIDAGDGTYPMRFTAVTRDGGAWTGYLAVDRVGPVLSLLSHVGPRRAVSPAEAAADRRTALGKARPLAHRLA